MINTNNLTPKEIEQISFCENKNCSLRLCKKHYSNIPPKYEDIYLLKDYQYKEDICLRKVDENGNPKGKNKRKRLV